MDYEFELEKFNFKAKTELSSFSDACESRLRDRFHNLFYDLRTTGTSEENLNILQSAKITIDNKPTSIRPSFHNGRTRTNKFFFN